MGKWIVLFILYASCTAASAQVYPIKKYSAANGLAHSNVFRIMQDKKGFLWFATNYGVSRFDGKSFTNYLSGTSSTSNVILSMTELANEEKLINTLGGMYVLSGDSIRPFKVKGHLPKRVIFSREYDGKIWVVALESGYDLYCITNGRAQKIIIPADKGDTVRVTKMMEIPGDGLIFITNKGLFKYEPGKKITPFLGGLIDTQAYTLAKDSAGNYWVGLNDALVYMNHSRIIYRLPISFKAGVSDILVDSRDNVWVIIPQLGVILVKNGKAENITDRLQLKKILINHMHEDPEGNIWMATHGDGVYKISSLNIINFFPESEKLNIYSRALLLAENNDIYAGSYGTVSLIRNNTLSLYKVTHLVSTDYIYFLKINNGLLYIGLPTGLLIKDMRSGNERFVKTAGAISFCIVGPGKFLIGGFQQLGMYSNGVFQPLQFPELAKRRVNSLLKLRDGSVVAGTDSGIYKIGTNAIHQITGIENEYFSVNDLREDAVGRLWLATDKGLLMKNGSAWKQFTETDGLSHNKVNVIAEDPDHNLWVGTQRGLNRIEKASLRITEHMTGLSPDEILSLVIDSSKRIIAGTVNGIAVIDKAGPEITSGPPPLYITRLTAADTVFLQPEVVTLQSQEQNIIIEFIAISNTYPGNVEYRYRIQNLYDEWNHTKNTSVELSSLGPGHYSFELQARVNRGEWSDSKKLTIDIPVPIWERWWFIVGITAILFTAFFLVIRRYLLEKDKKQREALELDSKMIHLKQQALNALINPHFIFNCLNSIQHYLNSNDREQANSYLAQFARLIRLTLEYAPEMYIPLPVETERLNLYLQLEKLRCGEKLQYKVEIDEQLVSSDHLIPNMILQPFVENAIWHGLMPKLTGGNLMVSIRRSEQDEIIFRISDNGVGFDPKETVESTDKGKHQSFGMNLIKERLELFTRLTGKVHIVTINSTTSGIGTTVKIVVPIVDR